MVRHESLTLDSTTCFLFLVLFLSGIFAIISIRRAGGAPARLRAAQQRRSRRSRAFMSSRTYAGYAQIYVHTP